MYGSNAATPRPEQNFRIGAFGILIVSVSAITGMIASFEPTPGMVYGTYALTLLGLVTFAVAVSRSNISTLVKQAVWCPPVMLVACPAVALLLT